MINNVSAWKNKFATEKYLRSKRKKQPMINIAFVIDSIETPNAGTEKQLLMLVDHLDRTEFSPHLIFLRNSQWLETADLPSSSFIIDLPSFQSLRLISAFRSFREYCEKHNINIVQTFFPDANLFGTVAAYLSHVKIIISSRRNIGAGYWHNKYWLVLLKALKHITTCYISNSEITAEYTVQKETVDRNKIHVIYNGLHLEQFKLISNNERDLCRASLDINPDHILIGAIANLRPIKNLPLFLKAAAKTHAKYPHARFIIIGEGPERPKLESMIREYSLETIVKLVGRQKDIFPFLAAMDIGVLCSRTESLSNSIIEYMAAGLPSVVSDVGGNLEAMGYVHGLSFKNDAPEDLSAQLERLILNEQLRLNIGRTAKEYAFATYNYKNIINQYENIYDKYYQMKYPAANCGVLKS